MTEDNVEEIHTSISNEFSFRKMYNGVKTVVALTASKYVLDSKVRERKHEKLFPL
jgi:hypothetical protein